jgi:ABC-type lipoprotein release transport system permease subunit
VINVPVNGTDEATVRANAWMFQQVLATGVHGILLCRADTPGAVRAFVEAIRFPANRGGVAALLTIVNLIATALPAWRAGRTDSISALRSD